MVERLEGRVSSKLKKAIEQYAKQREISVNECITQALEHILECDKVERIPRLRLIPLNFADKCRMCHRKLEVGERAYWAPGKVICIDCHVLKYGDKASVALHMKKRETKQLLKAFKNEIERRCQEIDELNLLEKGGKAIEVSLEMDKLVKKFLTETIGDTAREKEELDKIVETHKDNREIVAIVKELEERRIKRRKKRARIYA